MTNGTHAEEKPCTHGSRIRRLEAGGFVFTEASYPPGYRVARHEHERPSLTFVLDGGFTESFDAREFDCGPDALLVKPPDAAHSNRYGPAGARCLIIEILPERYRSLPPRMHRCLDRVALSHRGAAATLARRVRGELHAPDDLAPLAAEAIALELCTGLTRALRTGPVPAEPPWLARVRAFLHDEFRSPLTTGRIAEVAGVHPIHLARVFRAHHGSTPGAYVRRLRLDWAADALARTDAPLAAVAVEAGFFDQSHFSRAFRAHTGTTPGAWRAARRS